MRSPERLAANRLNAQKSTGPCTPAGKAKVAQNARRHGLATPISLDLTFSPRARPIATLLANGGAAGPAEPLAFALVELQRLRETRANILRETAAGMPPPTGAPQTHHTVVYLKALPRLFRLDRYERRIWANVRRELAAHDARLHEGLASAGQTEAAEQSHADRVTGALCTSSGEAEQSQAAIRSHRREACQSRSI